MTKIVEIIPDNLPDWARDSMNNGQLFNTMVKQFSRYLYTIKQLQKSIRRKNKYISMIDLENQRLTLELLDKNGE